MNKKSGVVFVFLFVALLSVSMVSAVWWNPFSWFGKEVRFSPSDSSNSTVNQTTLLTNSSVNQTTLLTNSSVNQTTLLTNSSNSTQPPCTNFTYSNWSVCSSGGQQNRSVLNRTPLGCTGGSPILTQNCTVAPAVNATLSYLGRTIDRVGTWSTGAPDGRPDFTLLLTLTASSPGQISNIRFNHNWAGESWLMIPSNSYRLWLAPASITSAAPASTATPVAYVAGTNKFLITLQPEHTPFEGGTATITLQSGQTITATVPKPSSLSCL